MPASIYGASPRGPLVVRLCNWVGEVVLAVPALRRLEAAGYELHLVGKGWATALLAGSGWATIVRRAGVGAAARQLRDLRQQLQAPAAMPSRRPAAVLLTKSFSSALEARLAGLRAVGYARDGRSWLLASAYPLPQFQHAAHAYWHLVSRFLGQDAPYPTLAELQPSYAQQASAAALLASRQLVAGSYVLLCPFSGADDRERRKVWPGFGALAATLSAQRIPLVVCPGPGEESLATALVPQAIQFTGTDLGVYAALLTSARCVVANDTGPGHLAAAVGARLISIYGPQSVAAWAPLGRHVQLLFSSSGWPDPAQVEASILR